MCFDHCGQPALMKQEMCTETQFYEKQIRETVPQNIICAHACYLLVIRIR